MPERNTGNTTLFLWQTFKGWVAGLFSLFWDERFKLLAKIFGGIVAFLVGAISFVITMEWISVEQFNKWTQPWISWLTTENSFFLYSLIGSILPAIFVIFVFVRWGGVPWSRASRPTYFFPFACSFNPLKWLEAWIYIMRFKRERYRVPEVPPVEDFALTEDPAGETVFICLEDDACGLRVGRPLPALLYYGDESGRDLADRTSNFVDRMLENDNSHKIGCFAIASRMNDSQRAEKVFFNATKSLIVDWADVQFQGKTQWGIRTDSCLRVHYAEETNALISAFKLEKWQHTGGKSDSEKEPSQSSPYVFDYDIFAPANVNEGRITNFGVQYIKDEETGQYKLMHSEKYATHFEGLEYPYSNLSRWLEFKSLKAKVDSDKPWKIIRKNVHLVNINELRSMAPSKIAEKILADRAINKRRPAAIVFDAEHASDFKIIAAVSRILENEHGKKLLYHSGTSLTAILSGNTKQSLVSLDDLKDYFPNARGPGMTIAGSMTELTAKQISVMTGEPRVNKARDIQAEDILHHRRVRALLDEVVDSIIDFVGGTDKYHPIVKTKKTIEDAPYPEKVFRTDVALFFADILRELVERECDPGFLLLKGSDTALVSLAKGLNACELDFIGSCEFAPGVFLCRIADQSNPWRHVPVFLCAGNSGEKDSLKRLYRSLASINKPTENENTK